MSFQTDKKGESFYIFNSNVTAYYHIHNQEEKMDVGSDRTEEQ